MVKIGFSLQGRGALADRDAITTLAQRADALGYDSIWLTDRLLIPVKSASSYGRGRATTARHGGSGAPRSGHDHDHVQGAAELPGRLGSQPDAAAGSPAQIVEDLAAYVAAGVEHFVLDFSVAAVPAMLDVLERTMTEVWPKIRVA